MELSNEDALRLNVLLANELQAVRIDEGKMLLHALSARGEMSIRLHPNCRDERYIRQVKELLSGYVLGSPGGYPVYLQRWTRMGQARGGNLEQLLLLGEPEAVAAVVHAPDLTPELARRAWWALQNAAHARQMLQHPAVRDSAFGVELAAFLIEFLPFEEEALTQAETVRLVLQPGLIDAASRAALWRKSQHKNAYLLGFLWGAADDLPAPVAAHPALPELSMRLHGLEANPCASTLLRLYSSAGQSFLQLAERLLKNLNNQEVVSLWVELVGAYYAAAVPSGVAQASLESLLAEAQQLSQQAPCAEVLARLPRLSAQLQAVLVLGRLSYAVLRPVFSNSDAIGSLMRKKLSGVSTPVSEQLKLLQAPLAF